MKKRRKQLELSALLILAVYVVILFFVLRSFRILHSDQRLNLRLAEADQTKQEVDEDADKDRENYREMVSRMASLTIFFLQHDSKKVVTQETLNTLKEAFRAEDIFQIDLKGNVLQATSSDYTEDFSEDAFAVLRDVSKGKPISEQIWYDPEAQLKNETEADEDHTKTTLDTSDYLCYQSAEDEEGGAIVLKKNWKKLRDYEKESSGWDAVLSRENIGGNGVLIAVAEDGTTIYNPLEEKEEADDSSGGVSEGSEEDSESAGVSEESAEYDGSGVSSEEGGKEEWTSAYSMPGDNVEQFGEIPLEDGVHGMFTVDGQKYIARVRKSQSDGTFLIAAVPYTRSAILFRMMILVPVSLILVLMMVRYVMSLIDHENEDGIWKSKESRFYRSLFYMQLLGLVISAVISIYAELLHFYAAQARSNEAEIKVISSVLNDIDRTQKDGRAMYQAYIQTLTDTAAALIADNPKIANTKELREFTDYLGVKHILVYDKAGKVRASDRNYSGLKLSKEEEDLSSEFRWLLYGEPLVVQDDVDKEYLDEPLVFAGSVIQDGDYGYDGFVQVAYEAAFRDRLVNSVAVRELVSTFRGDNESFAFAVGKDDGKIYAEDARLNQDDAQKAGLTDRELVDGFAGFFTLEGRRLFGTCAEGKYLYVFVACDVSSIFVNNMQSAVPAFLCAAVMLLALFVLFLVFCSRVRVHAGEFFIGTGISWGAYLSRCVFILSVAAFIVMILKAYLFPESSLSYYVFVFPWLKGLDIFSFTLGVINVLCVFFLVKCLLGVLGWLENILPFLQQTMIRMLRSFVRYLFLLGSIFVFADRLGAPARSLLASAGILTLIIGLAAQSIIADIFAGLSIIFERTYKVGDVIKVNTWRGKVIEIGIRNTRMIDLEDNNIKILNNSSVKAITNYSEIPVYCNVEVTVAYEDDLSRTEALLEQELPRMRKQISGITGEVHYAGAERITGKNAVLRFQAVCDTQDYEHVRRALERNLIVVLRRNGIQTDAHSS